MRFLILNTDYPDFLSHLYAAHPNLEQQSHAEQMRARSESLFGVADFYSRNLRKVGHEAWDIYVNNKFMQKAWAEEHGIPIKEPAPPKPLDRAAHQARRLLDNTPLVSLKPLLSRLKRGRNNHKNSFYRVLEAQIKYHRPEVLLNQSMPGVSPHFLKEIKPYVRLLLGQHAATPLPDREDFSAYDLVISSFPPTLDSFRRRGIPAELNRLAFEPAVISGLDVPQSTEPSFDLTFIGSFHSIHSSRLSFLEHLCGRFPQFRIWSPEINQASATSPISRCHAGPAWGREMYRILRNSKVTVNHHGNVPPYANNMRLFEATGIGALLITDWKQNLHEMFDPGTEVVAYRSAEECVRLIEYYLNHDDEREQIARRGQQRTLSEHTYYQRVQELVGIVRKYL